MGRAAVLRNGVAIVACIAVAVMALNGHEPSPPGTPPGPVELAVAEERVSVADGSPRERGSEPRRREAVRRYEPARREANRRDRVRRRRHSSVPSSHRVRAVADVADPSPAGAGSPSAGRDDGAGTRHAPPAGGRQRPGGAVPRAPRQDATGDGNAPAPAPPPAPPPPPPPAAVPAAPSLSTGVGEPADEVVGGAEEVDDDAGETASDD
jgi:transcription initiation factor TFIID subunit 2